MLFTNPLEVDVRTQINKQLENLGWNLDRKSQNCNVFQEQPKTEEERKNLKGKKPDYVLYEAGRTRPLIVIETKKRGANINLALEQGREYADVLKAPIVYATDGVYCKTYHTNREKPLFLNGEEIDEFIREILALRYLETNEIHTVSEKVRYSREELIKIFDETNNILRVEGLRAGIERFGEFSNILFLKLISENEAIKREKGENTFLPREFLWDNFKQKSEFEIVDFINKLVIPQIAGAYDDKDIFQSLQIKNGTVLKRIITRLDNLVLTDINSDIKGDAFEYFLKASTTSGNDLGEYFTPRNIVKAMVKLTNPQLGEKVYDPFCGTGGLLIESFRHIERNTVQTPQNLETLRYNTIYGNELTNTARITKMNMILAGDGHSNISMKNSLANPIEEKYHVVLTNMPYSQTTEYGNLYDLPTHNGDSICVQHCIRAIDKTYPNGRMAIVVPEGFLFRKDLKKTREYLLKNTYLQTVVSLPQGVFLPYTGVKTDILFCTKIGQKAQQNHFWFFDVKNDGYSLDNHRRKIEGENDLEHGFLPNRTSEEDLMKLDSFQLIDFEKVKKNDFVLSGNRYKEINFFESRWQKTKLSEVASYINGYAFKPSEWKAEGLPIIRIQNLTGTSEDFNYSDGIGIPLKYGVENGDLLISWSATIGFYIWNGGNALLNQHIFKVVPNISKINKMFLYFLGDKVITTIKQLAHGGTMQHITKELFDNIEIPLPPIEIQNQIVKELNSYKSIIDNAKSIIGNYKPTLPNSKEWEFVELGEVCDFSGGTQPPKSTFIYEPNDDYIRLLQIRDYKSDERAVYIPKAEKHKTCTETDIMIGRYGPPVFQILKGKKGAYNVALIKCLPKKNQLTENWLYYFLSSDPIQEHIIGLSERSRQAGVSPDDLRKLKIPLPPIEIQDKIVLELESETKLINQSKQMIEVFNRKINQKIDQLFD